MQTLCNALTSGTFGQAYLFSGLRGVGKTTAARLLAKAVNCAEGPTAEPCGECDSCREVADGSSIDVIEIDGASNRGIDDVRELRELLQFHPTRDRYRVIIVDEVHMLTREAFNALLKSLEEPPPYILWIFATTERLKVPDTILSRCQQLEFRPVGSELIRGRLEEIAAREGFTLAPSAAASIAAAAEGSVRDALSLLDQLRAFAADDVDDEAVASVLGVPPMEVTVQLVEALAAGRVAGGLGAGARSARQRSGCLGALPGDRPHPARRPLSGRRPGAGADNCLRPTVAFSWVLPSPAASTLESHARSVARTGAPGARCGKPRAGTRGGVVAARSLAVGAAGRGVASGCRPNRLRSWPFRVAVKFRTYEAFTGYHPPHLAAHLRLKRGGKEPAAEVTEEDSSLAEEAGSDPGVILATRVLGGEVVAVRSNGEGS